MTQKESNPFPYSDSNKRYYTYDYYLRSAFGGKCVKIPLDLGLTCPNIDGKCGFGGCIYCSGRGSGDFAASPLLSVKEQYAQIREKMEGKWDTAKCIPYFQAHTNTYASATFLRPYFTEAAELPGAVGVNIATRADCLEEDVLDLLAELSSKTVLTVELGLQTVNDRVAAMVNRGHTFADFLAGYTALRTRVPKARIGVHVIFGLPGEEQPQMLAGMEKIAALEPDEVKLHLLYVVAGTVLAKAYEAGEYRPMEKETYVETVAKALTLLPSKTVIGRLTGDGAESSLLAPLWSKKKISVINDIDKYLFANHLWQGKYCKNG